MWVLPFPHPLYWAFSSVESEAREKESRAKEQIKIRHDNTVSAWKTECARLKVAGTQPRDLATKLKRPLKPKPVVEGDLDDDEEEEDEQMIVHSYACVKWWFWPGIDSMLCI